MVPTAVLSDVHGNLPALDAVLDHARRHGATRVITLGDIAYGPLDPRGAVERLMGLDLPAIHIRGNEDRILWESREPVDVHRSLVYTRSALTERHLRWIQDLPEERVLDGMLLCHGSPGDDTRYLLESVSSHGLHSSSLEHLTRVLDPIAQDVILCGHSHLPGCVRTPRGALVVNPGSVGLQAFTDEMPHFHVIQNRSPHARYALLEPGDGGWTVTLVAVPYDWESAARMADLNARPDWARSLRSGWIG